jgi:hypothetical protein
MDSGSSNFHHYNPIEVSITCLNRILYLFEPSGCGVVIVSDTGKGHGSESSRKVDTWAFEQDGGLHRFQPLEQVDGFQPSHPQEGRLCHVQTRVENVVPVRYSYGLTISPSMLYRFPKISCSCQSAKPPAVNANNLQRGGNTWLWFFY